ncbi:hypothetical protein ZIOFF_063335 [Zingiber officinale]|uniref:Uncharacterized protein n=1 Tax=Zingiber officinale TaxID=94328 RepID=A0A8J5F635_ZINOF|nr:hypothetical protein ZIOFF_063335 [Zingiber officinale]
MKTYVCFACKQASSAGSIADCKGIRILAMASLFIVVSVHVYRTTAESEMHISTLYAPRRLPIFKQRESTSLSQNRLIFPCLEKAAESLMSKMAPKPLDYKLLNENVKKVAYVVKGELYLQASELQKEGKKVVALWQAPFLLDDTNVGLLFPADVIARAKHYLSLNSGGLAKLLCNLFPLVNGDLEKKCILYLFVHL